MAITPRGGCIGTHTFFAVGEITGRWFRPSCAEHMKIAALPVISHTDAGYDPYERMGVRVVVRGNDDTRYAVVDYFTRHGNGRRTPAQLVGQLYPRGPNATIPVWGDNMFVGTCPLWTDEEDAEFARSWGIGSEVAP